MEQILVYMTFPEEKTATRIGRALLEQRLVACVNILPRVESMYWWEDEIQHETEVAALAKTDSALFEPLKACVLGLHPYEVPCIVAVALDQGHTPFLQWIDEQTRDRSQK
ncbi:periplasmic divalent cation tolerance protein [Desulfomicrobium macestii]|uniref:Divalent cation tolerance protein n=2 Tax=Desulfomicrobium TaxID=898 RepID=A0A8G2BZI5_DESNO|nr:MULTISPECIES: divalent-cation tolerance protein CutA [Desulfomicrobium]MBE1423458.1 periplasmic divalent cation tolerance protein [Desulfomicrobium macestii]SFL25510.1 divalent cation tolerance protein [Desulfomicrobium norvegicum]